MLKSCVVALAAASVLMPCFAATDPLDAGLGTMWEALWHQSGTATRLVRWEQPELKVRITGVNVPAHRQHTIEALQDTAAQAGMSVVDVTGEPAQPADVSIEITPDTQMADMEPCATHLQFRTETKIDSVTMQMRDHDADRCIYHESMHVMGVRGHPSGESVLSYFTTQTEGLMPLDKVMLRAWYSPRMHGGMTPFEAMPVLADQLVSLMPDQQAAGRERDRFLARTVADMQAFADGAGDVPAIVKRSGKATGAGMRFGRTEMSYFLGVAYMKGASVARDNTQALRWLKRAADLGSRSAQATLASTGTSTVGAAANHS
jgi:hypothetical protein